MTASESYEVLRKLRDDSSNRDQTLPDLEHVPTPLEANIQATCECLSWRGTLDNLERRNAEDELGDTVYVDFPVHERTVLVTAHSLLERGGITEAELEAKMAEACTVRAHHAGGASAQQ